MERFYCPKCGKMHDSTEKYCLYCGHNLSREFKRFEKQVKLKEDLLKTEKNKAERKEYENTKNTLEDYYILDKSSERNNQPIASSIQAVSFIPSKSDKAKYKIEQKPDYEGEWDPRRRWYRNSYCYLGRRRRYTCFDLVNESCMVLPVFFIWSVIKILFEK